MITTERRGSGNGAKRIRRLLGVEFERGWSRWVGCDWDDKEVASVEDEEEVEDNELLDGAL